ncbi:hypothetical protein ACFUC1_14220 [Pedococcus sp. NPDC057267]|uniref:hypothetical protein n=1 Tax=Pedococcus sp. NPDC057267 TaxID=3346077 RepID=UPI00362762B0
MDRSRELRRQGRVAASSVVPLIGLGFLHLLLGGGWFWLGVIFAMLCLLGGIEFVHRKRTVAAVERAADAGKHLWRTFIPITSLRGLTVVPRLARIARVLVPFTVEVVDQALVLTPPAHYRRLGLGTGSILLKDVVRIDRHPLGHLRPDGSISSSAVTAVTLILGAGYPFDLIFDYRVDDFVSLMGQWEPHRGGHGKG